MKRLFQLILVAAVCLPHAGRAAEFNSVSTQGAFADVAAYVENAIINKGLTIDYSGEVNKMLQRTGEDVGSTKTIYTGSKFFLFCSAKLSREMMEADANNVGFCPFIVFVYETAAEPGVVHVGYRRPGPGNGDASNKALENVDKLLESIIKEAAE